MSIRTIDTQYHRSTQHFSSSVSQRFGYVFFCLAILFTVRIFDLMVVRGEDFRKVADDNRFFSRVLLPNRGIIRDRDGKALTSNVATFKVSKKPVALVYPTDLIDVSTETVLSYQISSPSSVFVENKRQYLAGPAFSHILGFVGMIEGTGMERIASLQERVGKAGAEKQFDTALRGTIGNRLFEMSATGKLLRIIEEDSAQAGKDVTLTIDSTLAQFSYEQLQGKVGSVIVSDVPSGQILALVSSPSFHIASYSAALTDEAKPLINRALSAYPPGSTFKMITALAGLESGEITTSTQVVDEGEIKAGGSTFGNWYFRQYGRTEGAISLVRALARSNDIYFYKVAEEIGPSKIADMASRFGFGTYTGIGLPEDTQGLAPTPAWKEKNIGEKWYLGDTYHYGIGQGYVLASPLQINSMTAGIARRGKSCSPRIQMHQPPDCRETGVKLEYLESVITGMIEACSEGGTAFPFFEMNKTNEVNKKIACKTGTAEFGGANEKGSRRTHGVFTMFYPSSDPKVAITVFLESTKETPYLEGSKDAGPIAKAVFEEWRREYEATQSAKTQQ